MGGRESEGKRKESACKVGGDPNKEEEGRKGYSREETRMGRAESRGDPVSTGREMGKGRNERKKTQFWLVSR